MRALASQSNEAANPLKKSGAKTQPIPVSSLFPQTASVSPGIVLRKAGCACGGGCPSCEEKASRTGIQTKLQVSSPGDQYEQEADRVADQIMTLPAVSTSADGRAPAGNKIQRRSLASDTSTFPSDVQSNQTSGRPLAAPTRDFMEPRFGTDFSDVRIHSDRNAHEKASELNARAFTLGRHIWLGRNETENDKNLMAHELTHVVQQSQKVGAANRIQRQTLVGRENECVAFADRELNVGAGTPLAETTTPGGHVIPGTRGSHQNCAGASLCGRQEYINWPGLGLQAADGVSRPGMTADWDLATYFVPRGCVPVSCSGVSVNVSRCNPTEREVIVFLYRWPAGVVRNTSTIVYQSDFHMIGRTPSTLPMAWESKMDRRERVDDIRDPWQSLHDAYPHTLQPDREVQQHCFCCDCARIVTR